FAPLKAALIWDKAADEQDYDVLVAAVTEYYTPQLCDKCSGKARDGPREDVVGTAVSTAQPGATGFRRQNGRGRGGTSNNSCRITSFSQLSKKAGGRGRGETGSHRRGQGRGRGQISGINR
ncbi:unnamed protein product, partial [Sphacelaria rigidula]